MRPARATAPSVSFERRRAIPRWQRIRRPGREIFLGTHLSPRIDQSSKGAPAGDSQRRGGRSFDLEVSAQPPLRRTAAVARVRIGCHGVALIRREQCTRAHRHGPVSILAMAARRLHHPGAQSGLPGPACAIEPGHFQIHHRSDRGLCRVDGGRCRCVLQLSGAGEFFAVRRGSPLQGFQWNHRDGDRTGAQ